ncbi:MAG: S41 family peptidase [Bacteroidetes bacterium]|nr:S41 family peptidase [Bacteroidota bacterium]
MPKVISWIPLICGLMLGAGILLGSKFSRENAEQNEIDASYGKIRAVLGYVNAHYVDSIDNKKLTDQALVSILQTLDPHSDYFTAEEVKAMNEPMQGNFQGIGIEYNFIRDTLVVMVPVKGGPSEKAGLQTGDRIITANDTSITGKSATEEFIKGKLRGPANTKVKLKYRRPSTGKISEVTIVRGTIPIFSIDAAYMLDNETGYVRLARFSETSYKEFVAASDSLLAMGMKKMILDLRENGGGLLNEATDIADEFLPEGDLIVYTKGRVDGEEITKATKKGKLEKMPLAVLVDENSASASEILAGAIQDNDRGIVIGRRTFGKGLVQEQQALTDGSAFRLTIARYYTPTGRCIQKPYNKGLDAYEADEANRYKNGELLNRDSIHFPDSLKYTTKKGKVVYGGGGIMPDDFVPLDTAGGSHYLDALFKKDIFAIWALEYSDHNRDALQKKGLNDFRKNFAVSDNLIAQLVKTATQNGIAENVAEEKRSADVMRRYMKATLARLTWGDAAYYVMWNDTEPVVTEALKQLD